MRGRKAFSAGDAHPRSLKFRRPWEGPVEGRSRRRGRYAAEVARLTRTFDRSAARYERGRPGYPSAAVDFLAARFDLGPGSTILDLASGTGKFTRALRSTGAALLAVEPMPGMQREFQRAVPDVPVLPGRADAIPLPDSFVDAVVVAQAFHWFHHVRALREIARVLRPGGGLGLIWNNRDLTVPWVREYTRLVDRHGLPRPRRHEAWEAVFRRRSSPFGPVRRRVFPNPQYLTPDALVDRTLSESRVQAQPAAVRRVVERELRVFLETHPSLRGRTRLAFPYETEVFYARKRASHPRRQRQPAHFPAAGAARPS